MPVDGPQIRRAAGELREMLDRGPALSRRSMGAVLLNCDEAQLFSPKSSLLNRLIAAYLLESGRFTLCPGMVEAVEERDHKYHGLGSPGQRADGGCRSRHPQAWTACDRRNPNRRATAKTARSGLSEHLEGNNLVAQHLGVGAAT